MAYHVRSDIENQFGTANVAKWAALGPSDTETQIAARIAWASEVAHAEVEDTLRHGPYTLPLSGSYISVTKAEAALAGFELHRSRGLEDEDPNRFTAVRDDARQVLQDILHGIRKLDCAKVGIGTSAPYVVR
jgi:hypothetical protein